ncbi:hypothetical protein [uncultured Roseobacter sp.]|uniref:hypothetical protein n=1 Tax=uncultured Roseobacter sp. TaxID=114847 RepID=UPI0026245F6E|nr:hypothetical protein [uncultured Roseobacter sp.]
MHHARPEDFFSSMAAAYAEGDFETIAGGFDAPGAVYLEDDIIVWNDTASLIETLKGHCEANYQLGTRRVSPEIIAKSMYGRQHFSVWVSWAHEDSAGKLLFRASMRYFFRRRRSGALSVQLVELPDRPRAYENEGIRPPFRRTREQTGRRCVV